MNTYTQQKITEAIAYWKKYLYKLQLNESQYSHDFEIMTMIELRKILRNRVTTDFKCVIFESTKKDDIDIIIKSFDKFDTLLVERSTFQDSINNNGIISHDNISSIIVNATKTEKSDIRYDMYKGFVVNETCYSWADCALVHTGDSSHMSDCYVIYRSHGRTEICGIEIKNSLDGILFSASAIIDTDQVSNIAAKISRDLMREFSYQSSKEYSLLHPVLIKPLNPDFSFEADMLKGDNAVRYKKYAQGFILNELLPKLLMHTDEINIRFTKDNLTQSYTNEDKLNDIKRDNIKLLMNKLVYEIKTAIDTIDNAESQDFLYYCFGALQSNWLQTKHDKYIKNDFKLATYNVRIGKSSGVISEFYKNRSRIRTVEIDDSNNIIKQHFMLHDYSDTYKPVFYIQTGENYNYNLYKIDGWNDPLKFDSSSKFKTGDIDTVYFGVNVEWGVRSDDTRGNNVRYDAKIYPQLTKRESIGSIVDKTHQVASKVQIDNGWKTLLHSLGHTEMTGYTST